LKKRRRENFSSIQGRTVQPRDPQPHKPTPPKPKNPKKKKKKIFELVLKRAIGDSIRGKGMEGGEVPSSFGKKHTPRTQSTQPRYPSAESSFPYIQSTGEFLRTYRGGGKPFLRKAKIFVRRELGNSFLAGARVGVLREGTNLYHPQKARQYQQPRAVFLSN